MKSMTMNTPGIGSMRIATGDLYRLRHAQLSAQREALKAQHAEQALREMLLEMEHQYGLLGTDAVIDIHTGEISTPSPNDGNQPAWENLAQTQEPAANEIPL